MRVKKCIAASILFGILMIGLTICTSAKVKIKENGEYRYRVLNQRSDEMRGYSFGIFDGIEQGICLVQYLGTEAEVEIPEEIDGLPVVYVGDRCFKNNEKLQKVELPSGLVSIGAEAFMGCRALEEITIPDKVTSIGTSGDQGNVGYTFACCSALKKVTILGKVKKIEMHLFDSCSALKTVILPDSVTEIGEYAFIGCDSLTKIKLPKGLKTIGVNAFRGSGLKGITIPGEVTKIERCAFARCASMKKIVLKGKNTKISPKAFKGIHADAVFQVPRGMTRIYRSRLTKRSTGFVAKTMKVI